MSYDIGVSDIMKEIGCGDGFHIPVANEENQLLEKEIKEMLQMKAKMLVTEELLDNELHEQKNIVTNLTSQEAQNQKLIIANRQQNETEQHMLMAAQRENDSLCRENKLAAKQLNELIEGQRKIESELAKNDEHIKKLKETIEWGEETLLAWNNDLAKQNTDVNILEAYHLEDNNRFKELDLRRQYLQRDVLERETIVEKQVKELVRVERELEQTSKLTRQAQQERNYLIEQWENAANFLSSNQQDTQSIVEEINKIRAAAREVYDDMNENKEKYQDHLEANEELEYEIGEAQKAINKLKTSILNQVSENDNLQSEFMVAQKTLNVLGNNLANERTKRKHMQNEVAKIKTQIQNKEADIVILKDNMLKIKNSSMTTEERLNELNTIYHDEKAATERLVSEKNKVLNMTFNIKNEIQQLEIKNDLLVNQLERNRHEQSTLNKEENKIKRIIIDKKEVLYNLNFRLERIRMKISEAEGTVDIEEMHNLQEKIQTLNGELSQAKDHQLQLEKHLKSAENESRRITKEMEKNTAEIDKSRNRMEELTVRNEGGEKQIQSLKEQSRRYYMEEMMVKLKLEQMKKMTDNECEKVYTLAQQKEELILGINKRKTELAAIRERLNAEKKLLLEEKSSAKRRLDTLIQYIDHRRNKYQVLSATVTSSGDGDDDDRSSFTIGEHKIRLAQEKLELQETGDQLDERVQKLVTEIRAMENTLNALNASNTIYKSSLSSVNPESDEYREKEALEETYDKLNSMWLQKKKALEKMQNELQDLEVQYKTSSEELENLINIQNIKDGELEHGLKEANEQIMKLNRANSRIQFDLKQIDKNYDSNTLELIKRDILLRLMKKMNKSVLEQLAEMSIRHIETETNIKQYLSEKDLELPTVSGLTFNKMKSNFGSSAVSLVNSTNGSVNSGYSDEDRKSLYSVVNLDPTPRNCTRKSGTSSIRNK